MDKRIAGGMAFAGMLLAGVSWWLLSPDDGAAPETPGSATPAVTAPAPAAAPARPGKAPKLTDEERAKAHREIRDALIEHAGLARIECQVPDAWTGAYHGMSDADVTDGTLTAAVDTETGVVLSNEGDLVLTWAGARGGETSPCRVLPTYDVAITFELDWTTPRPDQVSLKLNVLPEEGVREIPMPDDSITVSVPAGSMVIYDIEIAGGSSNALSDGGYSGTMFAHAPPDDPSTTVEWRGGDPHLMDAEQVAAWERGDPADDDSAGMVAMSRAEQQDLIGEHLSPTAAQVLKERVQREAASEQQQQRFEDSIDAMLRSHGIDLEK